MLETIEGLDDIFEAQARINRKKRNLQRRDDQTAADWLALAEEYRQIDSRANVAFCQSKARAFEDEPEYTHEKTEPEQEEWWNK